MDPRNDLLEFRIYSRRVMWAVIFFSGIIFIGGLKLSGIDFERLGGRSPTFRSGEHVCIAWKRLSSGTPESNFAEICVKWIDLGDTSGKTHSLDPKSINVSTGPQGEILVREKKRINLELLGALSYLLFLVLAGKVVQTKLINRRRMKILNKNIERREGI